MNSIPTLTPQQQQALQMVQTSNSIATPEELAALLVNPNVPRYGSLKKGQRINWMVSQIVSMNYLRHRNPDEVNEMDIMIDAEAFDKSAMEEPIFRALTQVEMQEAFVRGLNGEYGDYYGVTVSSLIGFLRGYLRGEKRRKAVSIIQSGEKDKLQKEDALFWATLKQAQDDGLIDLPSFEHSPMEDDQQHIERISRQREEILKKYETQH